MATLNLRRKPLHTFAGAGKKGGPLVSTQGAAPPPFGGNMKLSVYTEAQCDEWGETLQLVEMSGCAMPHVRPKSGSGLLLVITTFEGGERSGLAPSFYIYVPPCGIPDLQRLWGVAVSNMTRLAREAQV